VLNDKNKDINNEREHRFVAYFARSKECGGVVVLVLGKRERERERKDRTRHINLTTAFSSKQNLSGERTRAL
jgi:hypothetical protein|tara:strand:- start:86 stop:301 length:216 start_codon:yes stop_codon:yes gene_type:complete